MAAHHVEDRRRVGRPAAAFAQLCEPPGELNEVVAHEIGPSQSTSSRIETT
jgi:hypothetical protein